MQSKRLAAVGLLAASHALAAAHASEMMVMVADSRRYTGIRALLANIYNESHLAFALMTIITIPALGLLLGSLTDLAMRRIGINLKSRVLAEH